MHKLPERSGGTSPVPGSDLAHLARWENEGGTVRDRDASAPLPRRFRASDTGGRRGDLGRPVTGIGALRDEVLEVAVIANTDHAVIVADPAGVIRFWNPADEAMFGHGAREALGQTLDIIIPDKLRERHWDGYRRVMATGETDYSGRTLAVPALRSDGTRISVEFTVTLLCDDAGDVAAIAAILRDVTARWNEQRDLRRRLAELERELAALRS